MRIFKYYRQHEATRINIRIFNWPGRYLIGSLYIILIMNGRTNAEDVSYLSCQINGTRYILQTLSDTNEEEDTVDIVKDTDLRKEEEAISLVCLDGQVWYTFQNGIFQEIDINQIIGQMDNHERMLLLPRDVENCEDEYIADGNVVFENVNEHPEEQYKIVAEDLEKDFIIGKDHINANDFVEVVTAFKCKICTYTTQDKTQLLEHFEKIHVNPTVDIEVRIIGNLYSFQRNNQM